jgi:hypothetical protein
MFNWATFRQTKGTVKLHLLLDHDGYLAVYAHLSEGKVHEMIVAKSLNFAKGTVVVIDPGLYRLQTLRPLDQSRDLLCHPTQRERQLLGLRRSAATQEWQRFEGSVDPA